MVSSGDGELLAAILSNQVTTDIHEYGEYAKACSG